MSVSKEFTIQNSEVLTDIKTSLESSASSGDTSLTVSNNSGFSQNDFIMIDKLGSEKAEIKKIDSSVSAGTSLSVTALDFSHSKNAEVRKVTYDKVEISGDDGGNVGNNVIDTIDLQPDEFFTSYIHTGTEYDEYWYRYNNSQSATFSDYTDAIPDGEFSEHSVFYLIERALDESGQDMDRDTDLEWFLREINRALHDIQNSLKRWSFFESFETVIGQTKLGQNTFSLPNDIADDNNNKSIIEVRFAGDNLGYKDKREFNEEVEDAYRTKTRTSASAGDTSLNVDNSYDFADSGSIEVWEAGSKQTIDYSSVTRDDASGGTASLDGIPASGDGSIQSSISKGVNVWQNAETGNPVYYTVYGGNIRIWPLPDDSHNNFNVYLDYYTGKTNVTSRGDVINPPRYDAILEWLIWKLRTKEQSSGDLDLKDGHRQEYDRIKTSLIRRDKLGQTFKRKPDINSIDI